MEKEYDPKTFQRARRYLVYSLIIFFNLINLFYIPKSLVNSELIGTRPIIVQDRIPSPPITNNNNNNLNIESTPVIVGEKSKSEEEEEKKKIINKEKPKTTETKEDNQKEKEKQQEKESESTKEGKVLPPSQTKKKDNQRKEKEKNQNTFPLNKIKDKNINNKNIEKDKNNSQYDKEEIKQRRQKIIQQKIKRTYIHSIENFSMVSFIGILVYLIYSNSNIEKYQPPSNSQNKNRQTLKDNNTQNSNGYILLNEEYSEYYENI